MSIAFSGCLIINVNYLLQCHHLLHNDKQLISQLCQVIVYAPAPSLSQQSFLPSLNNPIDVNFFFDYPIHHLL